MVLLISKIIPKYKGCILQLTLLKNKIIMKKILLGFVFASITFIASAQIEPQAIGVRLGGGNLGGGFEVSYQHALGDANRLEADLGLNFYKNTTYFSVAGVYQWVWELGEGFNWYAGPGAQFIGVKNNASFGVGGQIGAEYNFNVNLDTPLLISLDTRPMMNFGSNANDFGWGVALGVRYTF